MKQILKINLTIQFILSGFIVPEVLYTFWQHNRIGDQYSASGYILCVLTIWIYSIIIFAKSFSNLKESK